MRLNGFSRGLGLLAVVSAAGLAAPVPEQAEQHFQQGLAYERLGRLQSSYLELQIAATLSPENAQVALALGTVAARLGRIDAARRALEQSISLDAGSVASYFQLAMIYESKNMKERALDAWHRFLGLSQDELLKQMAQKHIQHLDTE
jgi:Flp pilus assembly protein TadD